MDAERHPPAEALAVQVALEALEVQEVPEVQEAPEVRGVPEAQVEVLEVPELLPGTARRSAAFG